MKRFFAILLTISLLLAGCATGGPEETQEVSEETIAAAEAAAETTEAAEPAVAIPMEGVAIVLSDEGITVDGEAISSDETAAVYAANDIVYYEEGHDFTYGEGEEGDAHSPEEAAAHTVVHITQAGTYLVSGRLSAGQIAVDLGEDAETDPEAVVTLVLNNADITCAVAPAVIFYSVYECGSSDPETATYEVDTTAAGANVYLADGSENNISGAYVARIYEEGSVVLSEDGTEVAEAKKLHKYDAAFYSKMSMNVDGNDGILNITAANEGLDSELHLTLNGGQVNIVSGNDGINTNEDGVSVTTVNGGRLNITITGETGEGDGIDSNGWLVINGGSVISSACGFSEDAGIDSDMGIYLNGGTVLATGNMLDQIAGGSATYAVFQFAQAQTGGCSYTLNNAEGNPVLTHTPANDFRVLIISGSGLSEGEYTFYQDQTQLSAVAMQTMGGMGMMGEMGQGSGFESMDSGQIPDGMEKPDGQVPEFPEGEAFPGDMEQMTPPEGMENMTPPDGMEQFQPGQNPDAMEKPEGEAPELPEGETFPEEMEQMPQGGFGGMGMMGESSTAFAIVQGGNYFMNVAPVEE